MGGRTITPPRNRVSRDQALRLWTEANAWFSSEVGRKGRIAPGEFADLALLSEDFFAVPEDRIGGIESVLTVVGGRVVHGAGDFAPLAPSLPPAAPDWSPVRRFGGHWRAAGPLRAEAVAQRVAEACGCGTSCAVHGHAHAWARRAPVRDADQRGFWGALGCACWAV